MLAPWAARPGIALGIASVPSCTTWLASAASTPARLRQVPARPLVASFTSAASSALILSCWRRSSEPGPSRVQWSARPFSSTASARRDTVAEDQTDGAMPDADDGAASEPPPSPATPPLPTYASRYPSSSATSSAGPARSSPPPYRGASTGGNYVLRFSTAPHRLHVKASRNNTILTLTDSDGKKRLSRSGGSVGFRKAARSGYEAAYRAALEMFREMEDNQIRWRIGGVELVWNGFGQGREAVFRALLANEGRGVQAMVRTMTDATRIKIGGVRPKKRRRL